jgi:hypothetical protein
MTSRRSWVQEMNRGALRWPCKNCGAGRGETCRTKSGTPTAAPHVSRQDAYRRNVGALMPGGTAKTQP